MTKLVQRSRRCGERERARRGIAAYAHEQSIILRVLRKHGELTADDFDRIFGDSRIVVGKDGVSVICRRRIRLRFMSADPDSFIIGGFTGGGWTAWLQLMQLMMYVGLVDASTRDGMIVYRATANAASLKEAATSGETKVKK